MNLRTQYMGLELRSPLVVSACPLSEKMGNILRMEDSGAGAIVLFSLFEEQIQRELEARGHGPFAQKKYVKARGYFPDLHAYQSGVQKYMELIYDARSRLDIPVIASINGTTHSAWTEIAVELEEAGANGLEINLFYIPAYMQVDGRLIEQRYIDVVRSVANKVTIPVAVKLNPYFSAMGSVAGQIEMAGASGLVLFNRFYQPDIDIDNLKIVHSLDYSSPQEIRLPLMWIAFLSGRLKASLAATTGVHSGAEVVKYLLAGADVVMTASALYKCGIEYLQVLSNELRQWMLRMEFNALSDFRGLLNQKNADDPSALERANYIRILKEA